MVEAIKNNPDEAFIPSGYMQPLNAPSFISAPLESDKLPRISQTEPFKKDRISRAEIDNSPLTVFRPSKPQLAPPVSSHGLPQLAILKTLDNLHEMGKKIHLNQILSLDEIQEKIEQLQAENMKHLKESSERAKESAFWKVLGQIASCIASAINLVFGISLIAGGSPILGGIVIAAALITIANMAFSECGIWSWVAKQLANENEERERILVVALPLIVAILAAILSIAAIGALNFNCTGNAEQLALELNQLGTTEELAISLEGINTGVAATEELAISLEGINTGMGAAGDLAVSLENLNNVNNALGAAAGNGQALDISSQVLLITKVALGLAEGVATIGKGVNESQGLYSKAELTKVQKELTFNERDLEAVATNMEKTMKDLRQSTDHASKIIKLSVYANKLVTQPV
jgi:hypothetical protein